MIISGPRKDVVACHALARVDTLAECVTSFGYTGVPYREELRKVRLALERTEAGYPKWCCQRASRMVAVILGERYSLVELAGTYTRPGTKCEVNHSWNRDEERGLDIDLSMDQFGSVSKVVILPIGNGILTEHTRATQRQREFKCFRLDEFVREEYVRIGLITT